MRVKLLIKNTKLFILLICCLLCKDTWGQQVFSANNEVDIAAIQTQIELPHNHFQAATNTEAIVTPNDILDFTFQNADKLLPASGKLSGNTNAKNLLLKILFSNPTDTTLEVFFYPGYYFKSILLFKQSVDAVSNIQVAPTILPDFKFANSYRGIVLQPKEKCYVYIQLQPVKIQVNILKPQLINPAFLSAHAAIIREDNDQLNIITFIIVGILAMMFIFSLANFVVTQKKEFLFYCLYTLLNAVILFGKTYLQVSTSDFNYFFQEYFDFILFLWAIVCYVYFLKYFLKIDNQNNKLLNRVLNTLKILSIAFCFIYSFCYFLSDSITVLTWMELTMKYIIIGVGILFIIIGSKQRNKLMNYIVSGNLCVIICGIISLTIILTPLEEIYFFSNALFYTQMGIVGELAFFLLGLTYKSRTELIENVKTENVVQSENEKKGFEKQLAIIQARQEERNRISADMHDELGGGMTAIRLMSELAKQRINNNDLPEIEKISASANELLSKMNAIIWSMNPANDTLPNLVAYVRSYAYEFFETTPVNCTVNVRDDVPLIEISGVKRRNIFLAFKEALTNIIKHANATEVIINIIPDKYLNISIADNGSGIADEKIQSTNTGLATMKKRMEAVHGYFEIRNNNGTIVVLDAQL